MTVAFLIGNKPTVTVALKDTSGNLVDDPTMAATVQDPTGAKTTPTVTHVSLGTYSVDVLMAVAGTYTARFVSTNPIAASEVQIYCEPSQET